MENEHQQADATSTSAASGLSAGLDGVYSKVKTLQVNDTMTIFAHEELHSLVADCDVAPGCWVAFGAVGSERGLLIDGDDWGPFVEMVKAIDAWKKMPPNVRILGRVVTMPEAEIHASTASLSNDRLERISEKDK